jgi:hypothetical protein
MKRKLYCGYASEINKRFSPSEDQFSAKSRRGVDAFVVTGEAVGRVLRVVIRSCIREPVEAIRVLEF